MTSTISKNVDSKCVTTDKWDPLANDFSQPRANKLKGKNIYINNTQIRANLVLQTPLMRTWGISVFVNEAGEQQGGYSLTLVFDKEGYETEETSLFKKKIQQFEEEVIAKAYENRMAWFGDDDITLDTIRSGFYPMLKYPKLKDAKGNITKKKDLSKAPSLKLRVNNYDGKWQCRVYDTNLQPLFVPEDSDSSPIDFVPKNSMVITKIKCDGIWTGSANISWGIKWNLQVCVVQPLERVGGDPYSVSDMDTTKFAGITAATVATAAAPVANTQVDDSDEEEEPTVATVATVATVTPTAPVVADPVKEEPVDEEEDEPEPVKEEVVVKKKVTKKVVK